MASTGRSHCFYTLRLASKGILFGEPLWNSISRCLNIYVSSCFLQNAGNLMVNIILHSLYPMWLCRLFRGTNFSVLFFFQVSCRYFFRLHSPHLWQHSINWNKNKWTDRQADLHILTCWSRLLSIMCLFFIFVQMLKIIYLLEVVLDLI
jgi:hypothetical protein